MDIFKWVYLFMGVMYFVAYAFLTFENKQTFPCLGIAMLSFGVFLALNKKGNK